VAYSLALAQLQHLVKYFYLISAYLNVAPEFFTYVYAIWHLPLM
jgi:hypothetical protein